MDHFIQGFDYRLHTSLLGVSARIFVDEFGLLAISNSD